MGGTLSCFLTMIDTPGLPVEVDETFKIKENSSGGLWGFYFTMEQPAAQPVKKTGTTLDAPLLGIQSTVK